MPFHGPSCSDFSPCHDRLEKANSYLNLTWEVYGTDGGHAGVNETAAVLATTPQYVHPGYYDPQQAWWRQPGLSAYPFPSSIILYQPERGYPDFDPEKARIFYGRVVDRLESLIRTTIEKWERMQQER